MKKFFTQQRENKVYEFVKGYRGEGRDKAMFTHSEAIKDARFRGLTSMIIRYKVVVTDADTGELNELLTMVLNTKESAENYINKLQDIPKNYVTEIEEIEL